MKRFLPKVLVLACVLSLLAACSSNPLIGKWKGEIQSGHEAVNSMLAGLAGELEFTSKEMITRKGNMERREAVQYRENEDKSWSISTDGKTWEKIVLVDNDTIEWIAVLGVKMVYKRQK